MGLLDIDEKIVNHELTKEYMDNLEGWKYVTWRSNNARGATYGKNIYWSNNPRMIAGTIYYELRSKEWIFSASRWSVTSFMLKNDMMSIEIKKGVHTSDMLALLEANLYTELNFVLNNMELS
jgi:hypothetical protein